MLDNYYPPVALETIRMLPILLRQIEDRGADAFLEGSPYPQDAREILKKVLAPDNGRNEDFEPPSINPSEEEISEAMVLLEGDNIERELAILYSKMRAFGATLEGRTGGEDGAPKAKASDKSSYFRTTVSLMSKIVELREKASNVSQWLAFKNRVMSLLSSIMTPDQRNAFLEALEAEFGPPVAETSVENTLIAPENTPETPENPLD